MKGRTIVLLFITYLQISAQNIENTLGTNGDFLVKDALNTYLTLKQSSGLLGIGTNATTPRAQLEVGGIEGLLATGTYNAGTARTLGSGARMHWYPRKEAFRAGVAETSYWDDANIGRSSIAMGYQPRATGTASVAIGAFNRATGDYTLALGYYGYATGSHSIAIATNGYGSGVVASGIYSIAIGAGANTNNKDGAMVIGDDSYFQTAYAAQDNQLTMRFNGGYRLWTSYPDSTAGVYMRHGQSGWSNYCDRNMKENFEAVDGEWVLSKIKDIPITKWNYKKTDVNEKYIGPVAQDFYAAFQLNGTDSLGINSISIDGINMAAVQALEKRTESMQKTIALLSKQNEMLLNDNKELREQLSSLNNLKEELSEIKELKAELTSKLNVMKTMLSEKGKEINIAVSNK